MGKVARFFGLGRGRAPLPPPTYSNAAVIERIVKDEGVDNETARRWFGELLIFLDLAARSPKSLSPPPDVDKAWHAFLIHSKDYEAYCRERFGKIVHHQPGAAPDLQAYARAYDSRTNHQSQIDPGVWVPPVTAGAIAGADQPPNDHGDHHHGGDGPTPVVDNPGGGDSGGGSSCGSSCGSSG